MILCIGDELRHELGCAASLVLQGYKVLYLHFGDRYEPQKNRYVQTDHGCVQVPVIQVPSCSLLHAALNAEKLVPEVVKNSNFELVLTTPSVPFYAARYLARQQHIPLILRVWGVRANKIVAHVIYGKNYLDLFKFYPGILHNLYQIYSSRASIVMDDSTNNFLNMLVLNKTVIYPTYSSFYAEAGEKDFENNFVKPERYVLSLITFSKTGAVFRLEKPLLNVLIKIAIECPEIKIRIIGGTREEAMARFSLSLLPENILFVGKVSEFELRQLYLNATLVVMPLFFNSVSNRLLETLFYGKPLLTNTTSKLLHNKLEHMHHVYFSDNYDEYPNIVRKLLENVDLLDKLSSGSKEAYDRFFSVKIHGFAMDKIIRTYCSESKNNSVKHASN